MSRLGDILDQLIHEKMYIVYEKTNKKFSNSAIAERLLALSTREYSDALCSKGAGREALMSGVQWLR